jgi:hypothetical protein
MQGRVDAQETMISWGCQSWGIALPYKIASIGRFDLLTAIQSLISSVLQIFQIRRSQVPFHI